jgi:hypothetical protein
LVPFSGLLRDKRKKERKKKKKKPSVRRQEENKIKISTRVKK